MRVLEQCVRWQQATGTRRTTRTTACHAKGDAGSSIPTSSVVYMGGSAVDNANGNTYVSYCFAEIPGYSKFGKYTGNGSADGPFVWCGPWLTKIIVFFNLWKCLWTLGNKCLAFL